MRLIPSELPDNTLKLLMAALQAMVYDVHAPQDQLTATEWAEATAMCDVITAELDKRMEVKT